MKQLASNRQLDRSNRNYKSNSLRDFLFAKSLTEKSNIDLVFPSSQSTSQNQAMVDTVKYINIEPQTNFSFKTSRAESSFLNQNFFFDRGTYKFRRPSKQTRNKVDKNISHLIFRVSVARHCFGGKNDRIQGVKKADDFCMVVFRKTDKKRSILSVKKLKRTMSTKKKKEEEDVPVIFRTRITECLKK